MKISNFQVTPFVIPFVKPLKTAGETYKYREGVWLQLYYLNYIGIGEAAPLEGFNLETLKEVHYALEGFHQAVEGEDLERDDFLSLISIHTEDIPSSRFALETAIFDLMAQESGKSLSRFLNPNSKSKISVNGMADIHVPSDEFSVIKVKVGYRNLFDEIENMEYLTKLFGDEISFRLDANGAFDLPQAIRFCKEMEVFNIDYIEQPLAADNLEDMAELRYHTECPIAVDESLTDFQSAEKIIEEQAGDVFIIKPMVSGGFIECKNIINLAKNENIRTIVSSTLESGIGRTACFHLAAANEITEVCGLATGDLLIEDKIPVQIQKGSFPISKLPGMGIKL